MGYQSKGQGCYPHIAGSPTYLPLFMSSMITWLGGSELLADCVEHPPCRRIKVNRGAESANHPRGYATVQSDQVRGCTRHFPSYTTHGPSAGTSTSPPRVGSSESRLTPPCRPLLRFSSPCSRNTCCTILNALMSGCRWGSRWRRNGCVRGEAQEEQPGGDQG